jgi:hypothetical protein
VKIGYCKLGRTIGLTPASWGVVGGDNEGPILLQKLARRFPEHEFVLLGRNSGEVPQDVGFPPNVVNPFVDCADGVRAACKGNHTPMTPSEVEKTTRGLIEVWWPYVHDLDHVIIWAGQHGTSNTKIPNLKDGTLTNPQDSFVYYAGWLLQCLNFWRDQDPQRRRDIWLVPDPRNYLKGRDLKWPPARILAQYDWVKKEKHYRYQDPIPPSEYGYRPENVEWSGEPSVWLARHHYEYAGLELGGIPQSLARQSYPSWEERDRFGVLINENRTYVKQARLPILQEWILPAAPDWVHGKWTKKSLEALGADIEPIPWETAYQKLGTVRATFTTPASGTGWATTKPWEAFAAGTACAFHPGYDTQGHIIPTRDQLERGDFPESLKTLSRWLRPNKPDDFFQFVRIMSSDRDIWSWVVQEQRKLFDEQMSNPILFKKLSEELCRT